MHNYEPEHTQVDETDFVCRLSTGRVRGINVCAKRDSKGRVVQPYEVCVDATPLPENDAHADIYAHPEKASGKAYKLLREALAALARWEEGFAPSDREGN